MPATLQQYLLNGFNWNDLSRQDFPDITSYLLGAPSLYDYAYGDERAGMNMPNAEDVINELEGRFPKIYDWERERGGPQFDPRNALPADIVYGPNLFMA
jgi:hypothetical protein